MGKLYSGVTPSPPRKKPEPPAPLAAPKPAPRPQKPGGRYRSAITGRYVSAAYAAANPDTTVRESVKEKPKC